MWRWVKELKKAQYTNTPSHWIRPGNVEIRDGHVVTSGQHELYYPILYQAEILHEFVKVMDEETLISFVRKYGLLGQYQIRIQRLLSASSTLRHLRMTEEADKIEMLISSIPGDEVRWCLLQAENIRLVRDALAIADAGTNEEAEDMSKRLQEGFITANQHSIVFSFSGTYKSPREYLISFAANTINKHLENGIQPNVSIQPIASKDALKITFNIKTLLHWIYWYLANQSHWTQCRWCGEYFAKKDGREYCPGKACDVNYRTHKHRVIKQARENLKRGIGLDETLQIAVKRWNHVSYFHKTADDIKLWLDGEEES